MMLLCTGIVSGCTGQNLANPMSKLSAGTKSQLPVAQQVSAQQKSGDSPQMEAGLSPVEYPNVPSNGNAVDVAGNLDFQGDNIVTGSLGDSEVGMGQGNSKVERISNTVSASCRRILAEAGIESTMLRSPTVNASVNSDQDINLGASYDLLDLRRANLKEELALSRCTRDDAAAKLTQLLVTSNQSLSQAGYRAKADYLKRSKGKIASVNQAISKALNDGGLTIFRANALRQSLTKLQLDAARAEVEAQKRQIVRNIQGQSYVDLDRRLEQSETRIQFLESQMRSADAVKLKASVGYAQRGESSDDVTISSEGEVTAKFAVSMRLGAYSPQRFELEDVARDARAASLHETNRGILWRSREAARVNRSVVNGLHKQRKRVRVALSAAKSSVDAGASSYRPELLSAHLRGRIDVIRLSAELAALNATLSDTGRLDTKLTFRK